MALIFYYFYATIKPQIFLFKVFESTIMRQSILVLLFFYCTTIFAQKEPLEYFLHQTNYDKNIPSPESFLGYQIGEWHVSHDQLVAYMKEVARLSDRVEIEEYARSYEHRPLLLLTITSETNHQNIEKIRQSHLNLSDPKISKSIDIENMPTVVYQGYSVHGNEASGSNAAMLMVYYLAAGEGKNIEDLLDEVIILLDPSFNPDGMNRFANWVNSNRSKNLVGDPASRELNEVWPGGRTNHYWFDLNRDWLPVQHPESQGRIQNFHRWKPNILTDHHEMGSSNTFFFQPGIPSRTNPLTPQKNQDLTQKIATFHAAALDEIGSLYYSQESFDDFYYGKGSTYPDVNGSIGILFEQASARGHLHETKDGELSFPFAIRNQVKTSLSTLQAGKELRKELLNFQRDFYLNAKSEAAQDDQKAYVFSSPSDKARLRHFLELLDRHQISVYETTKNLQFGKKVFKASSSFIVPLEQTQYRLIKAMFETRTTFQDSLFYDVSAWTLPLAFNLDYEAVSSNKFSADLIGKEISVDQLAKTITQTPYSEYAYAFEWNEYYTPNALYFLLENDLNVKVSTASFSVETSEGIKDFQAGAILVPVQKQDKTPEDIHNLIQKASEKNGLKVYDCKSGLTPNGIDLGSPSFKTIEKPKVLLLVGDGVTGYDAGEVWHLLDQRYDIPVTLVETTDLSKANLENYTAIIMVNGSYSKLNSAEKIKNWTRKGGTLITIRGAISWAKSKGLANVKTKKKKEDANSKTERRSYSMVAADSGADVIGGSIFEAKIDLSHPLAFGYENEKIAVFRKGTLILEASKNAYATPLIYTSSPLLGGYSSTENIELIKNSAGIIVSGFGSGQVICMADNPNFRAFWFGTNKLLANAIFFGGIIDGRTMESEAPAKEKTD